MLLDCSILESKNVTFKLRRMDLTWRQDWLYQFCVAYSDRLVDCANGIKDLRRGAIVWCTVGHEWDLRRKPVRSCMAT
jgi:hypothetical protein